jgi:hypothetical protein
LSLRTENHWRKQEMKKKDKDSRAFRVMFGMSHDDLSWGDAGREKTRGRKTTRKARK